MIYLDGPSSIGSDARGDEVEDAVWRALRRVCESEGFDVASLAASASLVTDVGIDSLVFVEVAVALEEELGVPEFPLQGWADEEASKQDETYTLASLVAYARRCTARPEGPNG